MATLNKNVFTLCFEKNGDKIVYTSGNFFQINENEVKSIKEIGTIEKKLVWAYENFNITPSGFYFYQHIKSSPIKHTYIAENNKAYINNREVMIDGFTENAFATGHISYKNKPILDAFEVAAKNFNKFRIVENLVEVKEGNVSMSIFRAGNKSYIYTKNNTSHLNQFNEWSPEKIVDYVVEKTGINLSFMFDDLLESKTLLKNRIEEKLEETYELLSFLKSQKELLSSANKNIAEIKEADKLINSEIVKFEQIIKILEDDNLTKNDGYLDAKLLVAYQDAPEGMVVKVDALDYTTAGKDDMITIMANDAPIKVIKKHIELDSRDSI